MDPPHGLSPVGSTVCRHLCRRTNTHPWNLKQPFATTPTDGPPLVCTVVVAVVVVQTRIPGTSQNLVGPPLSGVPGVRVQTRGPSDMYQDLTPHASHRQTPPMPISHTSARNCHLWAHECALPWVRASQSSQRHRVHQI